MRVGCVVQGNSDQMAIFCGRHGVASVCIPDPQRASYRAMGLERTSWRQILFPSKEGKRRRVEARASGFPVSLEGTLQKNGDVLQLPGAALVGSDGRILWLHRGEAAYDLPPAHELVRVVRLKIKQP